MLARPPALCLVCKRVDRLYLFNLTAQQQLVVVSNRLIVINAGFQFYPVCCCHFRATQLTVSTGAMKMLIIGPG